MIFLFSSALTQKLRVTSDFKELARLSGNEKYSRTLLKDLLLTEFDTIDLWSEPGGRGS